ncbi:helix-turn-helix domain-containing protein [Sphingosinicellaceae bacterium]|nr:helix-turn-helix domain-containing protein [Sphingosinicellaceae bacterium]
MTDAILAEAIAQHRRLGELLEALAGQGEHWAGSRTVGGHGSTSQRQTATDAETTLEGLVRTARDHDPVMRITADGAVCQADTAQLVDRSVSTLERWRREGTQPPLPWLRRGTKIYYRLQAIADWFDAGGEQSFE